MVFKLSQRHRPRKPISIRRRARHLSQGGAGRREPFGTPHSREVPALPRLGGLDQTSASGLQKDAGAIWTFGQRQSAPIVAQARETRGEFVKRATQQGRDPFGLAGSENHVARSAAADAAAPAEEIAVRHFASHFEFY